MLRRLFAILALLAAPVTAAERPPRIPANDLLLGHSNFFTPPEVWNL